jgi:lipoyl-dependent peroxiredoxin
MPETVYAATATAWGGRTGHVESNDRRVALDLSVPAALGGDDGPGTNPEQLFATGYAACFHSALKSVLRKQGLKADDSAVTVTISLVGSAATGLDLAARIEAQIDGIARDVGLSALEQAHQLCPYSRATRGNITQELVLVGEEVPG